MAHRRKKNRNKRKVGVSEEQLLVMAPFDEDLPPQERMDVAVKLSELITRIATHIICYTLVDYQELLKDERLSIAHALLQRVTTTHLCNHKLTAEGLVLEYKGQSFQLHEEYKTMTLTRAVYEHLAMFYFLFEHPKTDEERTIVWKFWQINSMKNLLDSSADDDTSVDSDDGDDDDGPSPQEKIETLRSEILSMPLGQQCRHKLDEWTRVDSRPTNGSIEFIMNDGKYDVRRVTYSQAWKFLFASNDDMTLLYRHLSMHSHPVYTGLLQYQSQSGSDQGNDGIPLHISSSFLAYLCRLFLKLIPDGADIVSREFGDHDRRLFRVLAQLPK
jgi:hypothetical protein